MTTIGYCCCYQDSRNSHQMFHCMAPSSHARQILPITPRSGVIVYELICRSCETYLFRVRHLVCEISHKWMNKSKSGSNLWAVFHRTTACREYPGGRPRVSPAAAKRCL